MKNQIKRNLRRRTATLIKSNKWRNDHLADDLVRECQTIDLLFSMFGEGRISPNTFNYEMAKIDPMWAGP